MALMSLLICLKYGIGLRNGGRKKMTSKKMKELVNEVHDEISQSVGKVKKLKKLDLKAVKTITEVIDSVVTLVEERSEDIDGLTGKLKKKLAVEVINKYVNIPYVPEKLEGVIIGLLVDFLVNLLNKKFGKNWLSD